MERVRKKRSRPAGGPRKIFDKLPQIEGLSFGQTIGSGHFSEVFEGIYNSQPVAIKLIERGSEKLISTEIQILNQLRGCPEIIQLLAVINDITTVLVFEIVKPISFESFIDQISPQSMRFVLRSLLEATQYAHKFGIVHRDIKFGNILISTDLKELKLIDWGCGTYISDEMSPKAGSRTVRSPEMLIGYKGYKFGGDSWAIGSFILFILCEGELPWKCRTSPLTLISLSKFFGSEKIKDIASRNGIELDSEIVNELSELPIESLSEKFSKRLFHLIEPDLMDLMNKLMEIDYAHRLSIEEALKHPYFH